MTTTNPDDWLSLAALKARALRYKEGDYQVLSDLILIGALDHADGLATAAARPLRHSEVKALEDSPMTLLRMAQLNAQRRTQNTASVGHSAVVDLSEARKAAAPQWQPRPAVWGALRAARTEGSQQSDSVLSDCGRWSLSFNRHAQQEWTLLLKLLDDTELDELEAATAAGALVEFAVLDGAGNTLLLGSLDGYGELSGGWLYPEAPAVHIHQYRSAEGALRVVLV